MISLLIVAHGNLGESLIQCATHVLGQRPEALEHMDLAACEDADSILARAADLLQTLDRGEGVLILTDVYGATPCNTVCKLIQSDRVEAVSGVNLPMLLKALTYRDRDMNTLLHQAVSGGQAGIFHVQAQQAAHA
ncbi:MAG TPA: PTS fructose transporter subunit IIA [Thiobacillaceae bacterium]|nr:PTS fructose transporter subunit IIA [Thiobacillaceae bacterium]HNU64808.1 PTS fructose transporter subunit IIA [Thiobacillaceae bacterium]